MNIRVLSAYSGVLTSGRIVLPGVYAADDLRILDAAETMVRKGFAVYTSDPIPAPVIADAPPSNIPTFTVDDDDVIGGEVREEAIPVVTPNDEAVDYGTLSIGELRELVEARGLRVIGRGKNGTPKEADYIRVLKNADAAPGADGY